VTVRPSAFASRVARIRSSTVSPGTKRRLMERVRGVPVRAFRAPEELLRKRSPLRSIRASGR